MRNQLKKIFKANFKFLAPLFFIVVFVVVIIAFGRTYSKLEVSDLLYRGENRSGTNGTVVTVDDENADLYYYNSLNYTETGGTLPTGADLDKYNTSNMVKVMVTYYGRDFYDTNLVGTVSTTDGYNTFVYYHWYPVKNGKVTIPLIDNPFGKRPTGKGFNSWISNDEGVKVYLDKDTYERFAVVNPTSNGNGYADLSVSFYAH